MRWWMVLTGLLISISPTSVNAEPAAGPGSSVGAPPPGLVSDLTAELVAVLTAKYGLDAGQQSAAELLFESRAEGTLSRLQAIASALSAAKGGGKDLLTALRPLLKDLRDYETETAAIFRDEILDDAQRSLFDADPAKGLGLPKGK